jgi:toxin ParE1/3/4
MIVRYTPRAERNLEAILLYISERSPGGARNVWRSITTAVDVLADNPEIGVKTNRPGVRVRLAVGYPYKVFYRVRAEVVEILHIRHAARQVWRGL